MPDIKSAKDVAYAISRIVKDEFLGADLPTIIEGISTALVALSAGSFAELLAAGKGKLEDYDDLAMSIITIVSIQLEQSRLVMPEMLERVEEMNRTASN